MNIATRFIKEQNLEEKSNVFWHFSLVAYWYLDTFQILYDGIQL